MRPIVLTIAGSDSSGGAGLQADIKAIESWDCHAATVVTAVTAQCSRGVLSAEVLRARIVRAQLEAVLTDLDVRAVKSGMLGSAGVVREVVRALAAHEPMPYVLDPVLFSTSGFSLLSHAGIRALCRDLIPLASLITPNAVEASALTGLPVRDAEEAERAGRALLAMGPQAVLVKGGHLERDRATDVLVTPSGSTFLRGSVLPDGSTHGTGCIGSAAIAAFLARGVGLAESVREAKEFVRRSILAGQPLGRGAGTGPVDPLFRLREVVAGASRVGPR